MGYNKLNNTCNNIMSILRETELFFDIVAGNY